MKNPDQNTRKAEWFSDWFNTPYYHILYKNRNDEEAQQFIDNLLKVLQLEKGAKVLDLACGRGRHSIYLSEKKLDVTGIDISKENIAFARQVEKENLHFAVHDMRIPYADNEFDATFNLFTSFGYFNSTDQNVQVLKGIAQSLKPDGKFVIDFFNVHEVADNLVSFEEKKVDDINFIIRRKMENGSIVKTISFLADEQAWIFQERVDKLSIDDFTTMCAQAGLTINHVFGNYNLEPHEQCCSERLIIVGSKIG